MPGSLQTCCLLCRSSASGSCNMCPRQRDWHRRCCGCPSLARCPRSPRRSEVGRGGAIQCRVQHQRL
eukprot:3898019-Lingulodinium_polyedra.AAC.1